MWRYLWLCPVYIFIASLPLLTNTGQNLEYEYALLVAFLSATLIPLAALVTPQYMIPQAYGRYEPYIVFEIIWIAVVGPVLLLTPGFFGFVTNLCACSLQGFAFWMVLQALPAWVVAHAFYHLILRARCMGQTRRQILFAWLGLCGVLAVLALASIWFNPQVRLVNLFFGFIHGPIYDNWIPVDAGIVTSRLAHLALGLALLTLAWVQRDQRPAQIVVGTFLALWVILALAASRYPSVQTGHDSLQSMLPDQLSGPGYVIHYKAGRTKQARWRMRQLQRETSFHVSELKSMFGHVPAVDIYVYPNQNAKKLWFGGGATDVTDVFSPSVHITADKFPHATLRHELVHALASDFGFYGLGFHPNMAFTEGLAVALAPSEREISLHEGAASLLNTKRLPELDDLFSPMFWRESGRRAYTAAGSIISYLYDRFGMAKIKELYSGRSW